MPSAFDPPLDYAAVGFISGLEVHQQLLTERKLFCQCPAGRYTRTHDGTVLRHMRPTSQEPARDVGRFRTRKRPLSSPLRNSTRHSRPARYPQRNKNPMKSEYVLEAREVSKSFGGLKALSVDGETVYRVPSLSLPAGAYASGAASAKWACES